MGLVGLFFIGLIEFLCIIAFFIGIILLIWALLKKRRKLISILFIVCSFVILIEAVIVSELFYHDEMEQQRIEREKEEKEKEEKIIQQEEKSDVSQNQSSNGKSAKENQTDKDDEEVEKEENQTPEVQNTADSWSPPTIPKKQPENRSALHRYAPAALRTSFRAATPRAIKHRIVNDDVRKLQPALSTDEACNETDR